MERLIHGYRVLGQTIDDQTRCAHYHGPLDIIAIKFRCCGQFYPCRACHDEAADHPAQAWDRDQFNEAAILCGACGLVLPIAEYLACGHRCPRCRTLFNPGCANHHHWYFAG